MPRYTDIDNLIAEYDRVHVGPAGGARKLMTEAPIADVVPRAEVEKLQEVIFKKEDLMQKIAEERNKYADELEVAKDTNEHLAIMLLEAKRDGAWEILEEIEKIMASYQPHHTVGIWGDNRYAKLKKKYAEEQK